MELLLYFIAIASISFVGVALVFMLAIKMGLLPGVQLPWTK